MVLKENATIQDITWVESHELEYPELPHRNSAAAILSARHDAGARSRLRRRNQSRSSLKKPEYQARGLRPGDIIGKGGLEQYYDEYLRGTPGYRKVNR